MSSQFESILAGLGAKREGSGWKALCPAHVEKTPSLSVSEKGGTVLVHCHAGCSQDSVITALQSMGLWTSGQKVNRSSKPQVVTPRFDIDHDVIEKLHKALTPEMVELLETERMITREVINRYSLGQRDDRLAIPILGSLGRYEDIRFWLPERHRQDGTSKIHSFQKGSGYLKLFPRNQLEGESLVLVEGEMDALAAISNGIPTVTSTCGASTWSEALSSEFKGKSVTILMDHDEEGAEGALLRFHSLKGVAKSVLIAEWPKGRPAKHDVTDELRDFGRDSLLAILSAAKEPPNQTLVVCMNDVVARDVTFLWDPYLPLGKVTICDGDPGVGKSFFTCELAAIVSSGRSFPAQEAL